MKDATHYFLALCLIAQSHIRRESNFQPTSRPPGSALPLGLLPPRGVLRHRVQLWAPVGHDDGARGQHEREAHGEDGAGRRAQVRAEGKEEEVKGNIRCCLVPLSHALPKFRDGNLSKGHNLYPVCCVSYPKEIRDSNLSKGTHNVRTSSVASLTFVSWRNFGSATWSSP